MKASVECRVLVRALAHVQSVVERRNTIPILSNVLIEAGEDGLKLVATDLDLTVVETIPAQISSGGATTVSAHTLFDIVRKMPEGANPELSATDGRLSLSAGRSKFQLSTLPRADFPMVEDGALPFGFTIPALTLRQMIDRTRFAISTEETRYYLNGIFWHVTEEAQPALRAVATDGHRLARVAIPRPDGAVGMPDIIVPRKAIAEARKLLDEYDGDVRVGLSQTKIRFAFDHAVLTSKLIDGTFPDYDRVIPTANDKRLEISAKQLAQAVDRVATIATDKMRAIKLSVEADKVVLSVSSPEHGTAAEEIECAYAADPIEVGFNSKYLLDILAQVQSETVEIMMADAASPTLIRETADSPALYVLMPMRV